jgi:LmbE family N-acetylglucosaminyl deacetylase
MRQVTDAAVANGWVPAGSTLFGITPDAFGRAAEPHSHVLDVTEWVARKMAALRCHQTQMGPNNPFARLGAAEATRWLAIEHFRRAIGASGNTLLELIGEPAVSV